MIMKIKQRKIADCTKGETKPQNRRFVWNFLVFLIHEHTRKILRILYIVVSLARSRFSVIALSSI